MDRRRERLSQARTALATLEEILVQSLPPVVQRDAAIMRFVYTFEAVWRALELHLREVEGSRAATPKSVMRGARDAGILSTAETEAALEMVDDRNLTVHTYKEALALEIVSRLPAHVALMRHLLDRLAATK